MELKISNTERYFIKSNGRHSTYWWLYEIWSLSLHPDTFASKVAAIQDQYADASIGNVTGSNAVNVFLGIGVSPVPLISVWMTDSSCVCHHIAVAIILITHKSLNLHEWLSWLLLFMVAILSCYQIWLCWCFTGGMVHCCHLSQQQGGRVQGGSWQAGFLRHSLYHLCLYLCRHSVVPTATRDRWRAGWAPDCEGPDHHAVRQPVAPLHSVLIPGGLLPHPRLLRWWEMMKGRGKEESQWVGGGEPRWGGWTGGCRN